jgi:hypothetical protein
VTALFFLYRGGTLMFIKSTDYKKFKGGVPMKNVYLQEVQRRTVRINMKQF